MKLPDACVLVSGHVGAGKTTLARGLTAQAADWEYLASREVLMRLAKGRPNRRRLQQLGENLDRMTGGAWLRDAIFDHDRARVVVIDSVRIPKQIGLIRETVPRTVHIHLDAPAAVLAARYESRRNARREEELESYAAVLDNSTEAQVGSLAEFADLVLDTSACNPDECIAATKAVVARLLAEA